MVKVPTIIVTGASRGIGRAVVEHCFTKFPANILAVARSEAALRELIPIAESAGVRDRIHVVPGDLRDQKVQETIVHRCITNWGGIDGVVVNAGVLEPISPIADSKVDEWRNAFEVNFFSAVELIQRCISHLRSSKGRVVFVSSTAIERPKYGWGAYSTSKSALHTFTRTLAVEETDIVSVSIMPGIVDTMMQKLIREKGSAGMREEDYARFKSLYEDNKLVPADQPAHVIAALITGGAQRVHSGGVYSWDAEEMAAFRDR